MRKDKVGAPGLLLKVATSTLFLPSVLTFNANLAKLPSN